MKSAAWDPCDSGYIPAVCSAESRASEIGLGDIALVSGPGLAGNMAAQLAHLSGAVVIGIDTAPSRRGNPVIEDMKYSA